jgi:hypothetical protein
MDQPVDHSFASESPVVGGSHSKVSANASSQFRTPSPLLSTTMQQQVDLEQSCKKFLK